MLCPARIEDHRGIRMNWIEAIGEVWLTALGWIAGLGVLFFVLTRFSPCNPGRNWWADRRAALTDLVYWLVMPLVMQVGRVAFLVAGALLLYGSELPTEFAARSLPLWVQCIAILLIQDVLLYAIHRIFHTRAGWRFHAVHHSPEVLDWTSTQRFHPVNALAEFALADAVVLLMGFSPMALAILAPINMLYSVMVHANLNWTFGPLKYVFASPVFHRWHHTTEAEGLDRNFAPTFPFLDLLGGTFYMPAGKRPEVYGTGEVPAGFVGQMAYPFRGAGSWAVRRPAFAGTLALASISLAAYGAYALTRPIEVPEMAATTPSTRVTPEPPALLKLTRTDEKRDSTAVAVSSNGSRILFGAGDGKVTLRDLAGQELPTERHARRVNAVAFSPDGSLAVSASGDGTARVCSATTGKFLRTLADHGATVMSAAIGDDGWVATGTVDGTVRVWDPHGGLAKKRTLDAGSIHAVALADGGRRVVAAQANSATIWDSERDRIAACTGVKSLPYCVAMSADGRRAVAGDYDGRVLIWDADTAAPLAFGGHSGPVYSIAIGRDGGTILTGGADRAVRLWKPTGKLLREFDEHPGMIFAVSLGATQNRIAAAGKDGSIRVWNLAEEGIIPVVATEPAKR